MPRTIKNLKLTCLLVCAVVVLSCTSNATYNQYRSIESQSWSSNSNIEFIVNNADTISKNNVFINIRNNKDYAYSSLFLIGTIEYPSGFQVIDTLEYEMTDVTGNWLGSGFSDLKENKLFYKEEIIFQELGDYKINISHATRGIRDVEGIEPLMGITDVGLSIEKIE